MPDTGDWLLGGGHWIMGTDAAFRRLSQGGDLSSQLTLYKTMLSEEQILERLRKTLGRSPTKSGVLAGMVHFARDEPGRRRNA
jgi:hypothetical protein